MQSKKGIGSRAGLLSSAFAGANVVISIYQLSNGAIA
jgi:hypothetical protein